MTESGGPGPSSPVGAVVDAARSAALSKMTLLVVDDEPFILSALAGFFHHMLPGVEVRSAKTAREGLAVLGQGPVSLIISDYRMPDMDGIEFLRRCRDLDPGSIRVLFTAHADPDLQVEARERAGIAAFVPKGADPVLLLDAVRRALGLTPGLAGLRARMAKP